MTKTTKPQSRRGETKPDGLEQCSKVPSAISPQQWLSKAHDARGLGKSSAVSSKQPYSGAADARDNDGLHPSGHGHGEVNPQSEMASNDAARTGQGGIQPYPGFSDSQDAPGIRWTCLVDGWYAVLLSSSLLTIPASRRCLPGFSMHGCHHGKMILFFRADDLKIHAWKQVRRSGWSGDWLCRLGQYGQFSVMAASTVVVAPARHWPLCTQGRPTNGSEPYPACRCQRRLSPVCRCS